MAEEFSKNPVLQKLLMEAGFKAAVDVACIDAEMAEELTESRPELKDELLELAARARPSINGWARSVSVFGGLGGGGLAGCTVKLEIKSASPASDPPRGPEGPGTVKNAPPVPSVP